MEFYYEFDYYYNIITNYFKYRNQGRTIQYKFFIFKYFLGILK